MRRTYALIFLLLAGLAGCGGDDTDDSAPPEPDGAGPTIEDPGPIHVHGLGVNPKDGALFVATHTGLFRAPEDEPTAKRVADRYQDTMGFTVVGPDRFLGSGHPDAREELPPYLGLIESDDAGRSWREVSLMGDADFHVLEAADRRVYGFGSDYSSQAQEFLVSDDGGRSWDKRSPPGALLSLAISPDDVDVIVASVEGGPAPDGVYASDDGGKTWAARTEDLGLLAWNGQGLYLIDGSGQVSASGDGGSSWNDVGEIGGQPAAFEAAGDDLYAALHDGTVKRSTDGGSTWSVRSRPQATTTSG